MFECGRVMDMSLNRPALVALGSLLVRSRALESGSSSVGESSEPEQIDHQLELERREQPAA
jgi:hypothetical protein